MTKRSDKRTGLNRWLLATALLGLTLPAAAQSQTGVKTSQTSMKTGPGISVVQPWTRAMPPATRNGAGYLLIRNEGDTPDRLLGARSPRAKLVEIHEMTVTDGIMRMRAVPNGLTLPPGATVILRPQGLHLMLMGMAAPIVAGEAVPVTLRFEQAGDISVDLIAAPLGATQPVSP